jgi:hypothetical protein
MKKYFQITIILCSLFTILSLLLYPQIAPILGILTLLLSLSFAMHAIFQKHKGTQNARARISKETIQFLITLILISFLAGLAGLFVNTYISSIYGVGLGLLCALLVSFGVGYLVRRGVRRLTG